MMTVASDNIPYFRGVPRQRGRGLGALALSVARTAIPIFRNFIVPAAKKVGRDFVTSAVPELSDVISGKQSFKKALKSSAKKTIKNQVGGGSRALTRNHRRVTSSSTKTRRRRGRQRSTSTVTNKKRTKTTNKRTRKPGKKNTIKRKSKERSRNDFFQNLLE